jgi:hypothetical protein
VAAQCSGDASPHLVYHRGYDPNFEASLEAELEARLGASRRAFPGFLVHAPCDGFPWADVIAEHPLRSPLIPFVDRCLAVASSEAAAEATPTAEAAVPGARRPCPEVKLGRPLCLRRLNAWAGTVPATTAAAPAAWRRWDGCLRHAWPATEAAAAAALEHFLAGAPPAAEPSSGDGGVLGAARPVSHLASRLSPYLAHGVLAPATAQAAAAAASPRDVAILLRRLVWRDYSYHVWRLFPDMATERPAPSFYARPIREGYEGPASEGPPPQTLTPEASARLRLWQRGRTGFPLVDAGMRQLWQEGYMPQKVRGCSLGARARVRVH